MMNKSNEKLIKANLPYDYESYQNGNGEGIWISVKEDVANRVNENISTSFVFDAIVENDSVYYKNLNTGDTILVEARGLNRPVAVYSILKEREDHPSKETISNIKNNFKFLLDVKIMLQRILEKREDAYLICNKIDKLDIRYSLSLPQKEFRDFILKNITDIVE
ncbi:hypothetical protein U729_3167 (plasmid) [Clostridium baratii str. Sullivan]|uniref:Uncharacterized protein n=1 Tax=Clostridium baratii str. Sullivan TaxID=1415775 RepID=A0A0A7G2H3_9CLOT|nr:hypothetical protein [Clostridium baratii]AIY85240.1 hypothetical protein U729_3167 [Clostridium baratii str. Sullivan]